MSGFSVQPSDLTAAAARIDRSSEELAGSIKEIAGVQHAREAADSPEVAGAVMEMVEAWGTELAQLVVAVSEIGEKLRSASSGYASTDTQAGKWAASLMIGGAGGVVKAAPRGRHSGG